MPYTELIREQLIKTNINTLWDFISSPKNLEMIPPKSMKFHITSNNKDLAMPDLSMHACAIWSLSKTVPNSL